MLGWDLGALAIGDPHVIQVRAAVGAVPADGSLVLATIESGDFDAYSMDDVAVDIRKGTPSHAYLPLIMRP